ncbi:MAG TPA: hypothetical protein VNT26_06010, partial [Candidatus Sulfotelmatobacter sp.]|nr:hypothetical protein [Candidatus Sulfotelmatobacter sp.]
MLKLLSHFSHTLLRQSARRLRLLPALALVFWLAPGDAGAATFTAALDRDTITLGETATLSLTFQG